MKVLFSFINHIFLLQKMHYFTLNFSFVNHLAFFEAARNKQKNSHYVELLLSRVFKFFSFILITPLVLALILNFIVILSKKLFYFIQSTFHLVFNIKFRTGDLILSNYKRTQILSQKLFLNTILKLH